VAINTVFIPGLDSISFELVELVLKLNFSATFFEVMPRDVTTVSRDAPHFLTFGIR